MMVVKVIFVPFVKFSFFIINLHSNIVIIITTIYIKSNPKPVLGIGIVDIVLSFICVVLFIVLFVISISFGFSGLFSVCFTIFTFSIKSCSCFSSVLVCAVMFVTFICVLFVSLFALNFSVIVFVPTLFMS